MNIIKTKYRIKEERGRTKHVYIPQIKNLYTLFFWRNLVVTQDIRSDFKEKQFYTYNLAFECLKDFKYSKQIKNRTINTFEIKFFDTKHPKKAIHGGSKDFKVKCYNNDLIISSIFIAVFFIIWLSVILDEIGVF